MNLRLWGSVENFRNRYALSRAFFPALSSLSHDCGLMASVGGVELRYRAALQIPPGADLVQQQLPQQPQFVADLPAPLRQFSVLLERVWVAFLIHLPPVRERHAVLCYRQPMAVHCPHVLLNRRDRASEEKAHDCRPAGVLQPWLAQGIRQGFHGIRARGRRMGHQGRSARWDGCRHHRRRPGRRWLSPRWRRVARGP